MNQGMMLNLWWLVSMIQVFSDYHKSLINDRKQYGHKWMTIAIGMCDEEHDSDFCAIAT